MANTKKHARKCSVIREGTPGTGATPNIQLPVTAINATQEWDSIPDESIEGEAFADIPGQGNSSINFPMPFEVDVATIEAPLKWIFGSESSKVFSLPTDNNTEAMSIWFLDGVKQIELDGCYANNVVFSSEAGGPLACSVDVVAWKAEQRNTISWPAQSTTKGTRLYHRHLDGTGYARIGDQDDALASGDDQGLQSLSIGIDWKFGIQHDNTAQNPLQPLSGGAGRPEVSLSFTISRHAADTFLAWRDAHTSLQAAFYFYASATATLLIEVPNFVIPEGGITDDDVAMQEITAVVGRNGIGTSYSNSNMSFTTPFRATLVNS